MNRKIAIATMIGQNQGNRLQNYAMQSVLERMAQVPVETLLVGYGPTRVKRFVKGILCRFFPSKRWARFEEFDRNHICYSRRLISDSHLAESGYDLYVVGSDQVWNPSFEYTSDAEYLPQVPARKKISYAASFGVSDIVTGREHTGDLLRGFSHISVRERAGAEIVKRLTGRDAVLALDPTMLIEPNEWRLLAKQPKFNIPQDGYILKYVLGVNIDDESAREVSGTQGLRIIDLKDKTLPVGPAEFIWLIEHAKFVCTDSFHASVFSILFHVPFAIFERVSTDEDMSSRFDTLCELFRLEGRRVIKREHRVLAPIDWEAVDMSLRTACLKSIHYLEVCLHDAGLA